VIVYVTLPPWLTAVAVPTAGLDVPLGVRLVSVTVGPVAAEVNDAVTVQLAVMALVVYVLPLNEPPQVPPTEEMLYPEFGVTVYVLVVPKGTVEAPAGLIVPPVPALDVTV